MAKDAFAFNSNLRMRKNGLIRTNSASFLTTLFSFSNKPSISTLKGDTPLKIVLYRVAKHDQITSTNFLFFLHALFLSPYKTSGKTIRTDEINYLHSKL